MDGLTRAVLLIIATLLVFASCDRHPLINPLDPLCETDGNGDGGTDGTDDGSDDGGNGDATAMAEVLWERTTDGERLPLPIATYPLAWCFS